MIVSVGHSLTRTFGLHHLRVDPLLVWNANILQPLLDFRKGLMREQLDILDNSNMLIMLIQGFCGVMPVGGMGAIGQTVNLGLISRLGWKRAELDLGQEVWMMREMWRILWRSDFHSAVEVFSALMRNGARQTETLLSTQDICMSFVQVRGSVPCEYNP